MSDPYDIRKAKIDSLVNGFTNLGYKPTNRIGQTELLQFLNKRSSNGRFNHILSEKLFQVLNLDPMSTMFVEDFINGYLQFEDDIRRNAELFNIKLNQEQEIYANLAEQCRRYKSEKLNAEGMCENAKVYGEITDIDIKRKLEGIKEIIIKVVYNEKSEELHFKMGDENSNEMLNRTFGFKPTSRKDHFEFIMKGVNDRNQVFDIGSKVFPLTDVNSHEEYIVQIVVPEIDNEEEVAAYINAKIVLYWSDYKYFEKQKRKAESRLKKLTTAANKAAEFLKLVREIYGDLTKKKPDLIVDFNNEKLMQRKGAKLNVNFNNTKEAEGPGGNYLVEFNNYKEVRRTSEPLKVEFNNAKEVMIEKKKIIKEESVTKNIPVTNDVLVKETKVVTTQVNQPIPPIVKTEVVTQENVENVENIENVETMDNNVNEEVMSPENIALPQEIDENYVQQVQTETVVENGGEPYNMGDYYGNGATTTTTTTTTTEEINNYSQNQPDNGYAMAETIGYGTTDAMGSVDAYGTGGLEVIDQTNTGQLPDVHDIIKDTEMRTSINKALVNEKTNQTLFTSRTLPVKILETKVNETIYDNKVNARPLIFGGNKVTYLNQEEPNNYNFNNLIPTGDNNQGYNYSYEKHYENTTTYY